MNSNSFKTADFIDIVFDKPPGHDNPQFIEIEDSRGASMICGEWVARPDRAGGPWALRIPFAAGKASDDGPVVVGLETVKVFRGADARPEEWRVEAFFRDGAVEVSLFSGPHAESRATGYARRRYKDFTLEL
jgi:hypothetical protein